MKPVRQALKEAVSKIDSQEKADEVIEKLGTAAGDKTASDVKKEQTPVKDPAKAAQKVQTAAKSASETEQSKQAPRDDRQRLLVTADKRREQEAVSEAVQEVIESLNSRGQRRR